MKERLFKNTEVVAYFLWEATSYGNALDLWLCSEDIISFFEKQGIIEMKDLEFFLSKSRYDPIYICFLRNIAFRIFLCTKESDSVFNWSIAEKLIKNKEWCNACVIVADIYRHIRIQKNGLSEYIRSGWIRNNYL